MVIIASLQPRVLIVIEFQCRRISLVIHLNNFFKIFIIVNLVLVRDLNCKPLILGLNPRSLSSDRIFDCLFLPLIINEFIIPVNISICVTA